MSWLRNAFHVDKPGPAEPTDEQRPVVDRLCWEIVRRHMATPAIAFLEMSKPLNYVSAQVMHYLQPIVSVIFDTASYDKFAAFLEERGSVEFICRRIEALEAEAVVRERRGDLRQSGDDAPGG